MVVVVRGARDTGVDDVQVLGRMLFVVGYTVLHIVVKIVLEVLERRFKYGLLILRWEVKSVAGRMLKVVVSIKVEIVG